MTVFKLKENYGIHFREAQGEHRVVPGTNTPTRSTGVVSKAMEYIFGW